MRHLVDAVTQALDNKNWYAALSLALSLPDICGSLAYPTFGSQRRYVEWGKQFLEPYFSWPTHESGGRDEVYLRAADCYALRCAYLHLGDFDVTAQTRAREVLDRVVFTTGRHGNVTHIKPPGGDEGHLVQIQVHDFCEHVCCAVREWLDSVRGNAEVQARIDELPQVEPLPDWPDG